MHTVFVAYCHQLVHLICILNHKGLEVFDINSNISSLSDLQFRSIRSIRRGLAQDITHLFIIDLQVRHTDKESIKQWHSELISGISLDYRCL